MKGESRGDRGEREGDFTDSFNITYVFARLLGLKD
jgi:hypothetical protein